VAGKNVKVAIVSLYVDMHVRDCLRTVEQDFRAVSMGHCTHRHREWPVGFVFLACKSPVAAGREGNEFGGAVAKW
jgi:hypothetical protein